MKNPAPIGARFVFIGILCVFPPFYDPLGL